MAGRIDVVTIFPEYLEPARLSLLGKAQDQRRLELQVHDLRTWATDPHRTVDDTPYGGGAGMVMKADVWGRALGEVLSAAAAPVEQVVLIPTPAGAPLTQKRAQELAEVLGRGGQLVVACGRYEGIDYRIHEHFSPLVQEFSIGDYVLAGGEVAALVLIEAVGRLVPGVLGNPASLDEESHNQRLVEYPAYTKPPSWRELEVPAILRGGDHARIGRWRHLQSVLRTADARPDLFATHEVVVEAARNGDVDEIAELAAATFADTDPQARLQPADIEAHIQRHLSRAQIRGWVGQRGQHLLVARVAGAIVGYALVSVGADAAPPVALELADDAHRGPDGAVLGSSAPEGGPTDGAVVAGTLRPAESTDWQWAQLSKLYVYAPVRGRGVAPVLLAAAKAAARRSGAHGWWLSTNAANSRARAFYSRHGFQPAAYHQVHIGAASRENVVLKAPLAPPRFTSTSEGVAT